MLLRRYHQREMNSKFKLLRAYGWFDDWPDRSLNVVLPDSHRIVYKPKQVIAVGSTEQTRPSSLPQTFIVAKGRVHVLRKINVHLDLQSGRVSLATSSRLRHCANKSQPLKHIWVTSEPLRVGDVIPYMSNSTALVSEGCELICIPQASFLFRKNGDILDSIFKKVFMISATDEEVFRYFNQIQRWDWFCFRLRDEVESSRARPITV